MTKREMKEAAHRKYEERMRPFRTLPFEAFNKERILAAAERNKELHRISRLPDEHATPELAAAAELLRKNNYYVKAP